MRIFYSSDSDPMLLDTGAELNALHLRLNDFLTSSEMSISLPAETTLSPAPYQEFLCGLRLKKSQGLVMLTLTQDRWLELAGSEDNLAKYVSHFKFDKPEEDDHHHTDNGEHMARGTLRLIVEADSTWSECNAG